MAPSIWSSFLKAPYTPIRPEEASKEKLLYPGVGNNSDPESEHEPPQAALKLLWRWKLAAITSTSLLVLFILILSMLPSSETRKIPTIYSPAEAAVEYETVVFHNNFHEDRTPYQGPPTDAVDEAWNELYHDIGIIQIDKKAAEQLPNRTLPIPGSDDHFIVGIEVFHQLHCLNSIRKALYPDRYRETDGMTPTEILEYQIHLEHCVDSIRQTVQCYSDISTIPWIWNARHNRPAPDAHTTHVCRDFKKLQSWARKRAFTQEEYDIRLAAQHVG